MRTAATIIATAGLALLAAACGSPASHVARPSSVATRTTRSNTPTATSKYAAALAYSHCMRSHGVADFPDPKQVGDQIQILGSQSRMSPQSPTFKSAKQSCRHLQPGGLEPTHADQQQAVARMLHVSQCMRAHGISGFPDPTVSPPADRAGHSAIMSNDGAWLAIPSSIDVRSPAFEQAAAACKLDQS
jgi:hypothetical protein